VTKAQAATVRKLASDIEEKSYRALTALHDNPMEGEVWLILSRIACEAIRAAELCEITE